MRKSTDVTRVWYLVDASEAEAAETWLYWTIQKEVNADHPLMLGAIAEMILDAMREVRES